MDIIKKLRLIIIVMFFFQNNSLANYEKNFFDYQINSINGEVINLSKFKNNVVLLVNTASYCGFTNQYENLQNLWDKYRAKNFILIAVPSNSFNQEKKTDKEVKEFCEVNFNINFPITSIYDVKGENAHEIYKWAKNNHGKSAIPKWNFYKILINKDGKIVDTYSSFTKPDSDKITNKIESLL